LIPGFSVLCVLLASAVGTTIVKIEGVKEFPQNYQGGLTGCDAVQHSLTRNPDGA
jgi:hypothetical protein